MCFYRLPTVRSSPKAAAVFYKALRTPGFVDPKPVLDMSALRMYRILFAERGFPVGYLFVSGLQQTIDPCYVIWGRHVQAVNTTKRFQQNGVCVYAQDRAYLAIVNRPSAISRMLEI